MAAFLTYVLTGGPRWLRMLFLLLFLALLAFGCVQTYDNFRYATERQAPHHGHHAHPKPIRYVRR